MKFELEFDHDPWVRWYQKGLYWDVILCRNSYARNLITNENSDTTAVDTIYLPQWWMGVPK
jgi:hypothetical protein